MRTTFSLIDSQAIYGAAYRGLTQAQWHGVDFDVAIWPDGDARPIMSGCAPQSGAMPAMRNVSASDFGDWTPEETGEQEFISMCMECFGCVTLE